MVDLDVGGGLVDVVVNGVPLAILLFFAVIFLVVAPWGVGGLATVLQLGIILGTAVGLVAITYRGNRLIVQAPGGRAGTDSDDANGSGAVEDETDGDGAEETDDDGDNETDGDGDNEIDGDNGGAADHDDSDGVDPDVR